LRAGAGKLIDGGGTFGFAHTTGDEQQTVVADDAMTDVVVILDLTAPVGP
jgi:hypothetical protein